MLHNPQTNTTPSQDTNNELKPAHIYRPCIFWAVSVFIMLLTRNSSVKSKRISCLSLLDNSKDLTFLNFWRGEFFLFPLYSLLNDFALLLLPVCYMYGHGCGRVSGQLGGSVVQNRI